jgi:hypothetical protein
VNLKADGEHESEESNVACGGSTARQGTKVDIVEVKGEGELGEPAGGLEVF